jgi:hypothetical protein
MDCGQPITSLFREWAAFTPTGAASHSGAILSANRLAVIASRFVSGEDLFMCLFLTSFRSRLVCALPSTVFAIASLAICPPQASGTLSNHVPDRPLGCPVSTSNVCTAARHERSKARAQNHRIRTFLMLFPSCQANWPDIFDGRPPDDSSAWCRSYSGIS